ncbi:Uncharacterized protein ycf20 [Apostasia shenzhenica]|uniref:Uncharacterized protein ycf20 n=1 Tax=Apostasia shenzhenica TaxID=1088818 RepID=A0A2I0APS8_9ASPA|nr:Uncharacterized protein ycf20 [Apostasia shenzhenica]
MIDLTILINIFVVIDYVVYFNICFWFAVTQMACSLKSSVLLSLSSYGLNLGPNMFVGEISFPGQRSMRKSFRIHAMQDNEGRQRLVDIIRIIPEISRGYFRSRPRRALFGGISLLGGFYVAQTISLSFGALGVNDVIAAVVCVLLTEYVTRFYYSRPKVTFPIALLNNFKIGFTYGLFIDAFKLAS